MPRPKTGRLQVCLRLDPEWLDRADELSVSLARPGLTVTRTDVLRVAVEQGLRLLEKERKVRRGPR